MNQESVFIEFRRAPHTNFSAHDLLDVAHQVVALPAFRAERMHHNVILLAVNLKTFHGPIRSNLGGRVYQYVPIRKEPLRLTRPLGATIDDLPTAGWINDKLHW